MNKKLLGGVVSMFVMAVLAAMPVAAWAGPTPHWFSDGKLIGPEIVTVKTAGTLTFDLTQFGATVTCKVKDEETIANPAAGGPGTDEMTLFKLSACKTPVGAVSLCKTKMEVIALALPWASHLTVEPPAPGVRDVLEGVALEFRCKKGMNYGVFSGGLSPKVGNSVLEFEGGAALSGVFGTVTVSGEDSLKGPAGDKVITAA
jgi:hypothetical protein